MENWLADSRGRSAATHAASSSAERPSPWRRPRRSSWKWHSPRELTCSRPQPATTQVPRRANGRAVAMKSSKATPDRLQERSCEKHRPRHNISPLQPATEQAPGVVGRLRRALGRASNASSLSRLSARSRRQVSQRRVCLCVGVGQPGVRHRHAAVLRLSRSPVNNHSTSSHSPGRHFRSI